MRRKRGVLALLALSAVVMVVEPAFAEPKERPNLSHVIAPLSPQDAARIQEAQDDYKSGEAALKAKNFTAAEADFRASLALFPAKPTWAWPKP